MLLCAHLSYMEFSMLYTCEEAEEGHGGWDGGADVDAPSSHDTCCKTASNVASGLHTGLDLHAIHTHTSACLPTHTSLAVDLAEVTVKPTMSLQEGGGPAGHMHRAC